MGDYWVTHHDDGAVMRIEKLITFSRTSGAYLHDGTWCTLDEGVEVTVNPKKKTITVRNDDRFLTSYPFAVFSDLGKSFLLSPLILGAAEAQGIEIKTAEDR